MDSNPLLVFDDEREVDDAVVDFDALRSSSSPSHPPSTAASFTSRITSPPLLDFDDLQSILEEDPPLFDDLAVFPALPLPPSSSSAPLPSDDSDEGAPAYVLSAPPPSPPPSPPLPFSLRIGDSPKYPGAKIGQHPHPYERQTDDENAEDDAPEADAPLFKLLKFFDVDRTDTLEASRNYDLSHAVRSASERLNDLLQRERNGALLDPDEMAFLEAHQPLVDAAARSPEQLAAHLAVDLAAGLSDEEAARRAAEHGLNRLAGLRRSPRCGFFLKHLFRGPAAFWCFAIALACMILIFSSSSSVLSYLTLSTFSSSSSSSSSSSTSSSSSLVDASMAFLATRLLAYYLSPLVLLLLLFLCTGLFSHFMQPPAPRLKPSLTAIYPRYAKALRAGKWRRVSAESLVPGDVVELRIGDRVPADLRVFQAFGMRVSPLAPQDPGAAHLHAVSPDSLLEPVNPVDSHRLAFYGSHCAEGSGRGVVVQTGDRTLLGRLALQLPVEKEHPTFLQRDTSPLLLWLFVAAMLLCVLAIAVGFLLHGDIFVAFSLALLVVLAAVPSGLMTSGYLFELLSLRRVRATGVQVRQTNSLDAMARMSVLCCEKSALLTRRPAAIDALWLDGQELAADRVAAQHRAAPFDFVSRSSVPHLIRALAISFAEPLAARQMAAGGVDKRRYPDPIDRAVLPYLCGFADLPQLAKKYTQIYSVPSAAERFGALTVSRARMMEEDYRPLILVYKGAPEMVLERCAMLLLEGEITELREEYRAQIDQFIRKYSQQGHQVIAICQLELSPFDYPDDFDFDIHIANFPQKDYCFLGLISIPSIIKEIARETISEFRNAGIQVALITGDDPMTATTIARKLNIISPTNMTVEEISERDATPLDMIDQDRAKAIVIHGETLRHLSDDQLDHILADHEDIVFARTFRTQKLRIIQSFQRLGKVVGITGFTSSESPALRSADVGIARRSASKVVQRAAGFILGRNDIHHLFAAIAECRRFAESLTQLFTFILSHKAAQLLPTLLFLFLMYPFPFPPVILILIDTLFVGLMALAFAFNPTSPEIMLRPPPVRPPKTSTINWRVFSYAYLQMGIIQALAVIFSYLVILGQMSISPLDLQTLMPHFFDPQYLLILGGVTYDLSARYQLAGQLHSGLLVTLSLLQSVNLLSAQSQTASIFSPTVLRNYSLPFFIFCNLGITAMCIYIPRVNDLLWLSPIPFSYWCISLPFLAFLLTYQELIKLWIRKHPYGRIANHFIF